MFSRNRGGGRGAKRGAGGVSAGRKRARSTGRRIRRKRGRATPKGGFDGRSRRPFDHAGIEPALNRNRAGVEPESSRSRAGVEPESSRSRVGVGSESGRQPRCRGMQAVRSPRFRYRGWHGRASAMRTEPGLHGEAATDDRQSITGNPQSTHRTQARKPASTQARKHASAQARPIRAISARSGARRGDVTTRRRAAATPCSRYCATDPCASARPRRFRCRAARSRRRRRECFVPVRTARRRPRSDWRSRRKSGRPRALP
ncbi:Uncharacterised protein [Burkholderia pseudomallei]|nr:Uncharacterised protein [Burkholderia pseudomallei]CAJ9547708.1 Uncharacterised protein [Burkholderia pseudomallei]CFV80761.1 Uncharacterised protein [Burkholderia pseudomallei]CPH42266.1 Uncharacterised protein [Burkholderia pseudomallei]